MRPRFGSFGSFGSFGAVMGLVLLASPASAEPMPLGELGVTSGPGVVELLDSSGGHAAGVLAGTDLMPRYRGVGLGAGIARGASLLTSYSEAAVQFGLAHRFRRWRLEALGLYGTRRYSHWGIGLLSDDPGVSATLPYAGGKLRLGYFLRAVQDKVPMSLGVAVGLDDDLRRVALRYTYTETGWWWGESSEAQAEHTVGIMHLDVGLKFAAHFSLPHRAERRSSAPAAGTSDGGAQRGAAASAEPPR